jgi:hypothetical protein
MDQAFECLRCGALTIIKNAPVKCRECECGSGIIRPSDPHDDPRHPDYKSNHISRDDRT